MKFIIQPSNEKAKEEDGLIQIPQSVDLDSRIKPIITIKADHALVNRLKKRTNLIYPVKFEIFGRVSPTDIPDSISPVRFKLIEPDGKEIMFALFSARMLGWDIGINRGELLSKASLDEINRRLKKGSLSLCQVYDAFLLWNIFSAREKDQEYWIGVRPFKTQNLDEAIFQLRYDAEGNLCLLIGNMDESKTFASQSPILLRYTPK